MAGRANRLLRAVAHGALPCRAGNAAGIFIYGGGGDVHGDMVRHHAAGVIVFQKWRIT